MNIAKTGTSFNAIVAPVQYRSCGLTDIGLRILLILSVFISPVSVQAADCVLSGGRLISFQGTVSINGIPAQQHQIICPGERIATQQNSRAAIRLTATQTVIRIDRNSDFLIQPSSEGNSLLELLRGVLYLFSRQPESLQVEAPYMNAGVRGTEFVISANDERSEIIVVEGRVRASNEYGAVHLTSNEAAVAGPRQPPSRRVVIDAIDAVQWALYYPPVSVEEDTTSETRRAATLLASGDVESALAILANQPNDVVSLSLQSLVLITQNRVEEALILASEAVALDGNSSIAYTALSYVEQARFNIDKAFVAAQRAVNLSSSDAYALARIAELELGIGDSDSALVTAREAIRVQPDASRAWTVLGFVFLVRLQTQAASNIFEVAIENDQSDPLPRLGFGLAKIRTGELEMGRESIESAVSLDPDNALVRSYLGKAYFHERKFDYATTQFNLAKSLDPMDPTPWLYNAILLQYLNRPVEAYRNITQARSLNDNRLIYQSRLLVDRSAAAGSLSLASIYANLGFQQVAINEGTRSIDRDPTNFAAHQFLADSYALRARHESARRNILFQSTMRHPMASIPIQPDARESGLEIVPGAGPVQPAINEYTRLFDREDLRFSGSLVGGDRDILGDTAVISGLHQNVAFSLGQFHYENTGLRSNSDVEHDIYNFFAQTQIRDNLFVQAEYQRRVTDQGDLIRGRDPELLEPKSRNQFDNSFPRIGIRSNFNLKSTLLFSLRGIQNQSKSDTFALIPETETVERIRQVTESDGLSTSAQVIHERDQNTHRIGIDTYQFDMDLKSERDPCVADACDTLPTTFDRSLTSIYYQTNLFPAETLAITLGVNHTHVDDEFSKVRRSKIYPRLGIRWEFSRSEELRIAISSGTRRDRVADMTLEPVTLAGFNQLYDDATSSEFLSTGFAYDWDYSDAVKLGLEFGYREIDFAHLFLNPVLAELFRVIEPHYETVIRVYWYRILSENITLVIDFLYEDSSRKNATEDGELPPSKTPLSIKTVTLPIALNVNHPSGYFAKSVLSFIDQDVQTTVLPGPDAPPDFRADTSSESFVNLDLSIGYKPRSFDGSLSLELRNVFDESINYEDQNIQLPEVSDPRYALGRTVFARVSANF